VSFTVDAFPARRFRGKVYQVRNAPINLQGVVTYNAVARIDNKDLILKPGMTASVQFLVSRKENVVVIPNMAMRFRPADQKDEAQELLRQERSRTAKPVGTRRTSRAAGVGGGGGVARGNRSATIYLLKDGEAQPVEVQLGITDGTRSEVLGEGISENDAVIIGMSSAASTAQPGVANPFQPQRPGVRGLGR
jgi:HlyD family secretion protein